MPTGVLLRVRQSMAKSYTKKFVPESGKGAEECDEGKEGDQQDDEGKASD